MPDFVPLTEEELAAEFHRIYQEEATRQGDVRHADAYADLPENIKEFDRVLARYVIARLQEAERENARLREFTAKHDLSYRLAEHEAALAAEEEK